MAVAGSGGVGAVGGDGSIGLGGGGGVAGDGGVAYIDLLGSILTRGVAAHGISLPKVSAVAVAMPYKYLTGASRISESILLFGRDGGNAGDGAISISTVKETSPRQAMLRWVSMRRALVAAVD